MYILILPQTNSACFHSHFFYLINLYDELKITCGKHKRETIRHSHSVSIIKRADAFDSIIQSVKIQLIGSHYNCSSNGNVIIYHMFNFITEWLHNKNVMPYYRENEHILCLPSSASILSQNVITSNSTDVYTENKIPGISFHQLDKFISDIKKETIYLSNYLMTTNFNESIMQNTDDAKELLGIDSWFDEDVESSMIFIFVSCIIALVAFILLLFLCFKHERLRKLISLYMTSLTDITAPIDTTSCSTSDIFMDILSTICILILTYVIIKLFIRGCQHFHRY